MSVMKRVGASLGAVALSATLAWAQEHGAEGAEGAAQGGHAEKSLLAEHDAIYYSLIGTLVGIGIILFCKTRITTLSLRSPSRGQLLIEQAVASMQHFCKGAIGAGGEKFTAFVGTLFAYVLCSNLCGVLPFYINLPAHASMPMSLTPAPSANLSMTLALGIIVFFVFNIVGIKANGAGPYFKHFAGPIWWLAWLIFPIEIIGVLVRPLSLGMRLFGNVFGEETVIAFLVGTSMATFIVPLHTPMLALGVFGSVIQAGVFAILTCSYIALAIGDHGHDEHAHEAAHAH